MDTLCLVNLNARIYDPALGRMLSADPTIPHAQNGQSYNRYSYVLNNPLTLTDPSGYKDPNNHGAHPHIWCVNSCSYSDNPYGGPDQGSFFPGGDGSTPVYGGEWLGFMNGGIAGDAGGGSEGVFGDYGGSSGGFDFGGHWVGLDVPSFTGPDNVETVVVALMWVPDLGDGFLTWNGIPGGGDGADCQFICGGGLLFSMDASAGWGKLGAAAQYSIGRGYFSNGVTSKFQSYGALAQDYSWAAAIPAQNQQGTVVGAGGAAGGGFFLTNATSMDQLSGPFNASTLSVPGGFPSIQLAWSGSTVSGVLAPFAAGLIFRWRRGSGRGSGRELFRLPRSGPFPRQKFIEA